MADEGFLRRWSRLKSESQPTPVAPPAPSEFTPGARPNAHWPAMAARPGAAALAPGAPAGPPPPAPAGHTASPAFASGARTSTGASAPRAAPTLEDVAALTADSDFAPFVTREVDAGVRRSALRKLFTDPHFNRMDGLDVYIGDYTQASPMPAAMLAALDHARNIFGPPTEDPDATAATDASQSVVAAAAPDASQSMVGAAAPDASQSMVATAASDASQPMLAAAALDGDASQCAFAADDLAPDAPRTLPAAPPRTLPAALPRATAHPSPEGRRPAPAPAAAPPALSANPSSNMTLAAFSLDASTQSAHAASTTTDNIAAAPTAAAPETT